MNSYAIVGGGLGFTLQMATNARVSPLDTTNYIFGGQIQLTVLPESASRENLFRLVIPVNCRLQAVYWSILINGVLGTGENVQHMIRWRSGGGDVDVGQLNLVWNAVSVRGQVTDIGQAMSEGDSVWARFVTPVWVTNPTDTGVHCVCYFEQ